MVAALRGLVVGAGGAVLAGAGAGAVAWSPLTPIGLARQAEPDPGRDVDLLVIMAGAMALALGVAAWSALVGWTIVRRGAETSPSRSQSRTSEVSARLGARPPVVAGLALAVGHRDRVAASRSALVAAVAGIASLSEWRSGAGLG